ncbi:MAG: aggregation factor core [Pseudomonadota bacterium]
MAATDIEIDLSGSAAGLVFDVTSNGAGVEVFQPFELIAGSSAVVEQPTVRDGDQQLMLRLNELSDQQPVSFTIDVDDTVSARQITVSGSEIAGAQFTIQSAMGTKTGTFGPDAQATVAISGCNS